MPDKKQPVSVLFVCLGNICRSPMAEGVFRSLAKEPQYRDLIGRIDSSGTGAYHIGEPPDERTMSTLGSHGIADYRHAARKVRLADFDEFDYVFAMDRHNLQDLQRLKRGKPDSKAEVKMWGEYSGLPAPEHTSALRKKMAPPGEEVDDPYYGGRDGFSIAYEQCTRFSRNFLKDIFPDVKLP